MNRVIATAFALSMLASSVGAQDVNHDGFVSFLVPIISFEPIRGLQGTTWTTELWVHTDSPIRLRNCGFLVTEEGCPSHMPGVTERAFGSEISNRVNSLVYDLPSNIVAPSITLSNRLFEQSKHAQPVGVEVPVVREDKFFATPRRFIGVPNSSNSRIALRLYDPRRRSGLAARVEVLDGQNKVLAETVMSLVYGDGGPSGEPGVAAIYDLAASFPQLAGNQRFDVRVTPLQSGREYWALVSVTDNETQQVLLITADANNPA